jgi:RNA polymerase sigma-70 factor (ECF subfamily)
MAALPEERTLPDTDEQLAARIGRGDDGAFDELYRRYAKPLTGFAGRILRDPAAGEDVAQTALLNAFRSIRGGTVPLSVRPWLYRIAQNAALTAYRSRHGEIVEPEIEESPARAADTPFDREAWLSGLRSLPARQRLVYVLRDVNGVGTEEVGARVGLTAVQVEQALFAARNRLAEHLSFGGRVDCDTVRAVAAEEGDRRPLKAHLRACASCRDMLVKAKVGLVTSIGAWARQVAEWTLGGGVAPITAKVGAIVATTALGAAATPAAVHALEHAVSPTKPALQQAFGGLLVPPAAGPAPMDVFGASVAALAPGAATTTGWGHAAPAASPAAAGPSDPFADLSTAGADTSGDTIDQTGQDEGSHSSAEQDPAQAEPDPAAENPAPVDDTPPPDAPAPDGTPVDGAPVDATPADGVPVDAAPVDTVPVDTTPVDTTLAPTP